MAASRPILTQLACSDGDRAAEREPEHGRVLEVLLARDLLHAVGPAQQRLERDEGQRHELGDAAGALLQLAHDAHVLGELPRLLDVAEHDGRRRAQARQRWLASMISTQRPTGSLLGEIRSRTPSCSTSAAVPGVESRPASRSRAKTSDGGQRRDVAHVRDLHRAVGVQVQLGAGRAARSPSRAAASRGSPRAASRGGSPTGCRSRSRRSRAPRGCARRSPRASCS